MYSCNFHGERYAQGNTAELIQKILALHQTYSNSIRIFFFKCNFTAVWLKVMINILQRKCYNWSKRIHPNCRFCVVSTRNTRSVFLGYFHIAVFQYHANVFPH